MVGAEGLTVRRKLLQMFKIEMLAAKIPSRMPSADRGAATRGSAHTRRLEQILDGERNRLTGNTQKRERITMKHFLHLVHAQSGQSCTFQHVIEFAHSREASRNGCERIVTSE
jgi:hypothetical protein